GRDRGRSFGGHLRWRAATLAATRIVFGLWAPRPRRLDARRLTGLLGVVRRPGRVAQALRFVTLAQLEQRLERPDRVVDPGARAARWTSGYVQRGSIRTLTWIPREPDVFGQPTSPTASSASRVASATSRMWSQGTPGTGSRSTRSSSG